MNSAQQPKRRGAPKPPARRDPPYQSLGADPTRSPRARSVLLLFLVATVFVGGTLHDPEEPGPALDAEPVQGLPPSTPQPTQAHDPACFPIHCTPSPLASSNQEPAGQDPETRPAFSLPVWWGLPALAVASLVGKLWVLGPGILSSPLIRPLKWFILVPLFSRISRAELLHNPVRKKVSDHIRNHPGATIMEVRNALDIAWGTAVYHLDRLERNGELVGERRGNHHRYFQANTPEARVRSGWSTLQQPSAYNLARAIAENPGIHQKGLCEGLGLNNPAASKHLRKLCDAGLVEAQRVSRYVVYEPTDRLHSTLDLMAAQDDPMALPGHDRPDTDIPPDTA